jgi:preprotein translocase subunit SecB
MAKKSTAKKQETEQAQFSIQRIYLKDLSFETPQGAAAFQKQWKPKVNQDLNTKTKKIDEGVFEVALRVTITMADGEETIYVVEAEQAGLFTIKGFTEEQMPQVLNTTCPGILFPYLRETLDNVVTKGSFPALLLPPINFDALFANAVQQAEADAKAELKAEGKPEQIWDKILPGKMERFISDNTTLDQEQCLLDQNFIKNEKQSVADYVKTYGNVSVNGFVRVTLG